MADAWVPDDLDSPLDEAPLFYVEDRDAQPDSELVRVVRFRKLLRRDAPLVMLAAVPNGAARGQRALNRARSEGMLAGFPDLLLMAAGARIAFLEFKAGRGVVKAHQVACLNRLTRLGFPCGIFRQPMTAMVFLKKHGFPVELRT